MPPKRWTRDSRRIYELWKGPHEIVFGREFSSGSIGVERRKISPETDSQLKSGKILMGTSEQLYGGNEADRYRRIEPTVDQRIESAKHLLDARKIILKRLQKEVFPANLKSDLIRQLKAIEDKLELPSKFRYREQP